MNTVKISSREEFIKELSAADNIPTTEQKLKYLNTILTKYEDLLKPFKGIIPLSSNDIYVELKLRINKVTNKISVLYVSNAQKKDGSKIVIEKVNDEFIIWCKGEERLKLFLKKLFERRLILNYKENEIEKIIKQHFIISNQNGNRKKIIKKIQWRLDYPQLAYLIIELVNNDLIYDNNEPYALIESHFSSKDGKRIDNKTVARSVLQSKDLHKGDKPLDSDMIDEILKSVMEYGK